MKRLELYLEGRRTRYYEAGSGPPVLLVHGAGGTGKIWAGLVRRISGSFMCIAPDLPGFGGSEFYDGCAVSYGYADFLAGFTSALGVTGALVVASSMGGRAACMLAARHPELAGRLVLIAPSGAGYLPQDRLVGLVGKANEGALNKSELERALATIVELRRRGGLAPLDDNLLKSVMSPTVIIWGEHDDVLPPSHAELFSKAIPESRVVTIKDAGHMPFLDNPEDIADIILKFKIN